MNTALFVKLDKCIGLLKNWTEFENGQVTSLLRGICHLFNVRKITKLIQFKIGRMMSLRMFSVNLD